MTDPRDRLDRRLTRIVRYIGLAVAIIAFVVAVMVLWRLAGEP